MEPYLAKALWRAGAKLGVGLAVLGAIVGLRFVTAKPAGLESDLAELERFDAEQAAAPESDVAHEAGGAGSNGEASAESATADREPARADTPGDAASATPSGNGSDLDRMVRCRFGGGRQFMRAADCSTRGGELEELPPPPPRDAAAQP